MGFFGAAHRWEGGGGEGHDTIINVITIKQQVSHVTAIKQQQLYFVPTIKQ